MSSERFRERFLSGDNPASGDSPTSGDDPLSGDDPIFGDDMTTHGNGTAGDERPHAPQSSPAAANEMSSELFRQRLLVAERQAAERLAAEDQAADIAQFIPAVTPVPAARPTPPRPAPVARPAAPRPTAPPRPSGMPTPARSTYVDVPEQASARWRPRHWRLRTKLIALTVVPLLLALVLAALRVADTARAYSRSTTVRETIVIGSIGLLALIFLALLIRSIVKPLRILRASAFDVADRRLPAVVELLRTTDGRALDDLVNIEPVPIYTREDVGQVARAFDAVHSEAVRLAAEQAALRATVNDMFVNLSRRSQSLVERQLQLIDELERGEQDPNRLASLFRLDHLATRMRRNGENLLVLAGSELRQRSGEPVPVIDVLRAAVSEVEDYRRIAIEQLPQALIAGRAVNDIVHLVAELLDNATAYSNPESEVKLSARIAGQMGLTIEIGDVGAGIPLGRLVAINERLANPPEVDVGVSRQMGLFVVGRLARRHGITVNLSSEGDGSGVTVTVTLPRELFTDPQAEFVPRTNGLRPSPSRPTPRPSLTSVQDDLPPASGAPPASGPPTELPDLPPPPDLFEDMPAATKDAFETPIFQSMLSKWFLERPEQPTMPAEDISSPVPTQNSPAGNATQNSPPGNAWSPSEADAGWRAAAAINEPLEHELTPAGLPKRRPQAFLVPGSIDVTGEHPAVVDSRNADVVRGRMSSYQRGLRRGRHSRLVGAGDQPGNEQNDGGEGQ